MMREKAGFITQSLCQRIQITEKSNQEYTDLRRQDALNKRTSYKQFWLEQKCQRIYCITSSRKHNKVQYSHSRKISSQLLKYWAEFNCRDRTCTGRLLYMLAIRSFTNYQTEGTHDRWSPWCLHGSARKYLDPQASLWQRTKHKWNQQRISLRLKV